MNHRGVSLGPACCVPRTLRGAVRRAGDTSAALLAVATALLLAGCAIDPTVIDVEITSAAEMPQIPVLQIAVTRDADPLSPGVARYVPVRSSASVDGGRPAFIFPVTMSMTVRDGWSGPATLTVEARLWDEAANTEGLVVASGTARVTVAPRQRVRTSVTLEPGPLTCPNASVDPGEECDDGNRSGGDGCSPGCRRETTTTDGGADSGGGPDAA